MPRAVTLASLVEISVTPRFEIFYALQALESGTGPQLDGWRREMERRLPARVRTGLAAVAPSPLLWPLLADALREEPATITFPQMMTALRAMDEASFQRSVLGGVFKSPGSVDGLVTGKVPLSETVGAEAKTQERLLSLVGLYPFARRAGSVVTFEKIVSGAGAYRDEVVSALEAFWIAGFSDSWKALEPRMRESARAMKNQIDRDGFASFASGRSLPITVEGDAIVTVRSGARTQLRSVVSLNLIPSVFNTARLWAAYADSHKHTHFFIPVLDMGLSPESMAVIEPATIFKALGDTTRYAIASMIARTPMTSVELARAFGVSKPTITHHVQQLRSAGLIEEDQAENGVVLSLNRRVLERASEAAAREMFSEGKPAQVIRRTRRANK